MAVEYEQSIGDYLAAIKRKLLIIVVAFLILLGIAAAVAILLPPVYQSKGTILIESQQISKDLVQGAAATYAGERIEVIKQRVLTRENLLKIIEKHKLYSKDRKDLTSSELVDRMREAIIINLLSADTGKRNNKVTIAFEVSYDSERADLAHKVANELVTLFLDENVKARTESATETTVFLTEQADGLRKALEEIEDKVATFKQKNSNSLPEHQELYMASLQRMELGIKDIEREIKATQDELRFLDVELTGARAGYGSRQQGQPAALNPVSELDKLKNEYTVLQGTYKENHPNLKLLKSKIALLEKAQAAQPKQDTNVEQKPMLQETDLLVAKIEAQIESAKSKLSSLGQQKLGMQAKMAQLEQQVAQTPQVQRELTALERDYQNAKSKYEEVRSKQLNAKITENLEEDNKAERFSLVEPPILPDVPIKPQRIKVFGIGASLSLFAPIGLVVLFEVMNKHVRGVAGITAVTGYSPLVVIPYIPNLDEHKKDRKLIKRIVLILLIFIFSVLAIIQIFIMPLDVLWVKIIARF